MSARWDKLSTISDSAECSAVSGKCQTKFVILRLCGKTDFDFLYVTTVIMYCGNIGLEMQLEPEQEPKKRK